MDNNEAKGSYRLENVDGLICEVKRLRENSEFANLEERISNIEKRLTKKPYECPVCEGLGEVITYKSHLTVLRFDEWGRAYKVCHGCAGNGIVWSS